MFRILWDPSSGSIKRASLKLLVMFCVRSLCLANFTLPNTDYAHTNITSNFSEARLILP